MPPKAPRHPYAYTLDLLKLAIDRLPPTFPAKRKKEYSSRLAKFKKNESLPYADIQATIAELGKESWPVRKAYEELYGRYGRSSEESFLLGHLDAGIREKYERFINEGGKLNYLSTTVRSEDDLRKPSPFERYFTPEEKFAIGEALVEARDQARKEIDGLVTGAKQGEYEVMVALYASRQKKMEAILAELKRMATVSPKWRAEIEDRVATLEEGWSVVGQDTDLAGLEQEAEYWKGTLATFLHA